MPLPEDLEERLQAVPCANIAAALQRAAPHALYSDDQRCILALAGTLQVCGELELIELSELLATPVKSELDSAQRRNGSAKLAELQKRIDRLEAEHEAQLRNVTAERDEARKQRDDANEDANRSKAQVEQLRQQLEAAQSKAKKESK